MASPRDALLHLAYGAQATQLVYVAAKLGLADLLEDGPLTATDLAGAANVDAALLRRVLRALVSLGVFVEAPGGRFALTEMGRYLQADRPDSLQSRVLLNAEVLQPLWAELVQTLRTGESAVARVHGMSFYEYLSAHPEIGALFDRTMASAAVSRRGPAVVAYDFGKFATIVDVGGGNGALLIEILRAYDRPRGIVFDLPAVAERARQNIATADLSDRCTTVSGSAFETVPEGGDAYVLSNFQVAMDDERAVEILRRSRAAMPPGGTLLLVEWVMPAGGVGPDSFIAWEMTTIDIIMLANNGAAGGRVRTADEFRHLLQAGGFALTAIIPTTSSVSVIEARPMPTSAD